LSFFLNTVVSGETMHSFSSMQLKQK